MCDQVVHVIDIDIFKARAKEGAGNGLTPLSKKWKFLYIVLLVFRKSLFSIMVKLFFDPNFFIHFLPPKTISWLPLDLE